MTDKAKLRRKSALSAIGAAMALLVGSVGHAQTPSGPLPQGLSEAARRALAEAAKRTEPPVTDIPARRAFIDKYQNDFGALQRRRYAVTMATTSMAGVPVRLIKAAGASGRSAQVLLNLHGGGFSTDSGSQTENIPIAALTGIPVVAVLYRLAPEHSFPAGVDDALAVYRELLKSHKPSEIGIYGTSAGAILGPQLIARIHKEGLPEPAVFGMFSGDTDFSRKGDTLSSLPFDVTPFYKIYAGAIPLTDPMVSPSLGEVGFFPPTLCVSSSRDFYLSGTANFCRSLELAGVENKFVVFDGLPHAFWSYLETPESDQAFQVMARFLSGHLRPRGGGRAR